jgi:lysozyme family protein
VKDNFARAFLFVCDREGWYSNHPADYGGETLLGISKRYWPKEFEEIKTLPDDKKLLYARDFYEINFWRKFNCNSYVYPLDIIIFDSTVNTGRTFYAEGDKWYDVLLKRIKYHNDKVEKDPTQLVHLRGWMNRCYLLYSTFVKET